MKIWTNTICHNEENFIWFSVMSVVDFVDKMIIWDTGSTDKTVEIIREMIKIKGSKIEFRQVGPVDSQTLVLRRQEMLDRSRCDWVIILDADEIWSKESIKDLVQELSKKESQSLPAVVVPFYNLVGDIYHYQKESLGRYNILGKRGHLQVKAINRQLEGLHVKGKYPLEGFYDKDDDLIQENSKLKFLSSKYFHASHLRRSSLKRKYFKYKFDPGVKFPQNFTLPEVFSAPRPAIVPSPFGKRGIFYEVVSNLLLPPLFIKRKAERLVR